MNPKSEKSTIGIGVGVAKPALPSSFCKNSDCKLDTCALNSDTEDSSVSMFY